MIQRKDFLTMVNVEIGIPCYFIPNTGFTILQYLYTRFMYQRTSILKIMSSSEIYTTVILLLTGT